jgi:hypothetical protein
MVFGVVITGAEISSQYVKESKPKIEGRSRFTFAVHEEDQFKLLKP